MVSISARRNATFATVTVPRLYGRSAVRPITVARVQQPQMKIMTSVAANIHEGTRLRFMERHVIQ